MGLGKTHGHSGKQIVGGEPLKYCSGCQTTKPNTEFWKNKSTPDGYQSWCKVCWKTVTDKRRNGPKREIELRQRQNRHLIRNFGITIEDFEKMLAGQEGVCAICGNESDNHTRRLIVDHDHNTGKIRGLLCGRCNKSIGLFKDNVDYLTSAIKYLSKYRRSI